jgi:hypothetical protein
MKNFDTISEATRQLQLQGFTDRFEMEGDRLKNLETGDTYSPDELKILEMHRFEGISNPSDMSILFAVETADGRRGNIISSYGTYGNRQLLDFMDEVERVS